MKRIVAKMGLVAILMGTLLVSSCSKKDGGGTVGDTDEAAAQRLVGTYKGTIHVLSGPDYFNAEVYITKENGATVKIAPKSGQPYSGVTTKIVQVEAVQGTQNVAAENAAITLIYQVNNKSINYLLKQQNQSDVSYQFEGTKQ